MYIYIYTLFDNLTFAHALKITNRKSWNSLRSILSVSGGGEIKDMEERFLLFLLRERSNLLGLYPYPKLSKKFLGQRRGEERKRGERDPTTCDRRRTQSSTIRSTNRSPTLYPRERGNLKWREKGREKTLDILGSAVAKNFAPARSAAVHRGSFLSHRPDEQGANELSAPEETRREVSSSSSTFSSAFQKFPWRIRNSPLRRPSMPISQSIISQGTEMKIFFFFFFLASNYRAKEDPGKVWLIDLLDKERVSRLE